MTLKTKMSLLVFFTTVSIVSVGFSAWSITVESQVEIGGRIEVDNVLDVKDCIYLDDDYGDDNSGISIFKYYDTGFIDSNRYIVDTASIIVYYEMDIKKCNDLFSPLNTMQLEITLKYSDEDTDCILLSNYLKNVEINCSANYTSGGITTSNNSYTLPIEFKNILENYKSSDESTRYVKFSIAYNFEYTGNDFTNEVYKYLYENELQFRFVTKATATGGE